MLHELPWFLLCVQCAVGPDEDSRVKEDSRALVPTQTTATTTTTITTTTSHARLKPCTGNASITPQMI